MICTTLSHYSIEAELGRGGMGIVYKARDTKLNREVALKVLPSAALATDDDRARFYREAQAAAQLHHANIATIFEIDEAVPSDAPHGTLASPFIVMEYIEGETLDARIKKGPLKLSEAVRIAMEMAAALELAHSKNIVHRDVKSANVMLTDKGSAKVLDFGLAKTAQSTQLTRLGSTLGTVAYMSPEQARGEEVDLRTDLWALGVVLYEMIAGRSPFGGDYEQAVVYNILNEAAEPLTAVRTGVPMELERITNKLLAKSAGNRYQSANDLLVDLRTADLGSSKSTVSTSHLSGSVHMPAPPAVKKSIPAWVWAVGGLFLGLALMQLIALPVRNAPQPTAVHAQINLPPGVSLAPGLTAPLSLDRTAVAISSDGSLLAIVGTYEETSSIYLREMSANTFRRIPGTEGAYGVAFSPNGANIAFFNGDRLFIVPVFGGSPREIARVALPYGLVWLDDDRLVMADEEGERLKIVQVSTKSETTLNILAREGSQLLEGENFIPTSITPNGLVLADSWSMNGAYLIDLESNIAEPYAGQIIAAKMMASGYVVAIDGNGASISPVHLKTAESLGNAVPLVDSLYVRFATQFALSDTGTFVAARGGNLRRTYLKYLNNDGSVSMLPFPENSYGDFDISPDGRQLAIRVNRVGGSDLWVYDLERGSSKRLSDKGRTFSPVWSADSRSVYYQHRFSTESSLLKQQIDGVSRPDTVSTRTTVPQFVTPDGKYIGVLTRSADNSVDFMYVDTSNPDVLLPIAANPNATEVLSNLSDSGDYIAYTSSETGLYEIYVQTFPPDGRVWNVSVGGGEEPRWADNDRTLYHRNGDNMYSISIEYGPDGPVFGAPSLVYSGAFENVGGYSFDVSPIDGRIMVLKGAMDPQPVTSLELITNVTSFIKD